MKAQKFHSSRQVIRGLWAHLHVLVVLCMGLLLLTSPWVLLGRELKYNGNVWNIMHVYLGIVCALLGGLFLLKNIQQNKWRQYYPWLCGDVSQLKQDIVGLTRAKIPAAGGKGLFSVIEGIGLLLLLGTGLTGMGWYVCQGSAIALDWRSYHQLFSQGFTGFVIVHLLLALSHILDFFRH